MSYYRPGYCDALEAIATNTLAQNLRLLDDLDGRGKMQPPYDEEAVRNEARRQIESEFVRKAERPHMESTMCRNAGFLPRRTSP